jgi:hypothetical protein
MKEVSYLSVMDRMVDEDNQGIRMTSNICDIKNVTQGTIIGFGIEKAVGDDAMIQYTAGLPGEYMFMCFAINRKEFNTTKLKLQESVERKFFVREQYNTAHKNKLDTALREAFENFENKIITESQLNEFRDIHKKISDDYFATGGKCKPIDYSYSADGAFRPTSSRKNETVFVTDGYWLEIIEVKE